MKFLPKLCEKKFPKVPHCVVHYYTKDLRRVNFAFLHIVGGQKDSTMNVYKCLYFSTSLLIWYVEFEEFFVKSNKEREPILLLYYFLRVIFERFLWLFSVKLLQDLFFICFSRLLVTLATPNSNARYSTQKEWERFSVILKTYLAEYWAEFTIVDRWQWWHSYLFAVFIGVPMYIIFISIYYFIWTYICDFTLPMPFIFYVGASITYSLTFYFVWFR